MPPRRNPRVCLIVARGKPYGEAIPVPGPRFTIGRDETCHLRPHSDQVSRRHAELAVTTDGVLLRDLGSRNGTRVNGRLIGAPTRLRDGDRIEVGPLAFLVSIRDAPATMTTDRPPSDDEITSWLVADEGNAAAVGPSDIPIGETVESDARPELAAPAGPAPTRPPARDTSDAARALLRAMMERRPVSS